MASKPRTDNEPWLILECLRCGKKYDPEGYDPLGGDCPVVRDIETGEIITADDVFPNLETFMDAFPEFEVRRG